jgi:hypothetical protein
MRIRQRITLFAAAVAGLVIGGALVVLHNSPGGSLLPGPGRRQAGAEATLRRVIPEVRFRAAPLGKALEELRSRVGATFIIDWDALGEDGVSRDDRVDVSLTRVTLEQALKAVCGYAGAGGDRRSPQYTLFDGAVVITSEESLGKYVYAGVYDLRGVETPVFEPAPAMVQGAAPATSNLCFFNPQQSRDVAPQVEADDELTRLIGETVSPDQWYDAGGTGGTVHAFGGRVVAVTTWQNHRRIESLASQLRNPSR